MRRADVDVAGTEILERACRLGDRPGGIDHVVRQQAILALHLADHVHHLGHVRGGAALVDDRERGVQALGKAAGHLRRTHVGGDDDEILQLLLAVMRGEDRRRVQMVHRDVEEPLQLMRVEVDTEHAVGAGAHDHVRDELRTDRDARLILTVLAGIAVVREHAGDARGRRAARGVDQQQQLQHVLGGRVGRLDDEDIGAAHILVEPDEDLAVGESRDRGLAELRSQRLADLVGERPIGRAGEHTIAVDGDCQSVHVGES